jgi:hypothetical protein
MAKQVIGKRQALRKKGHPAVPSEPDWRDMGCRFATASSVQRKIRWRSMPPATSLRSTCYGGSWRSWQNSFLTIGSDAAAKDRYTLPAQRVCALQYAHQKKLAKARLPEQANCRTDAGRRELLGSSAFPLHEVWHRWILPDPVARHAVVALVRRRQLTSDSKESAPYSLVLWSHVARSA